MLRLLSLLDTFTQTGDAVGNDTKVNLHLP